MEFAPIILVGSFWYFCRHKSTQNKEVVTYFQVKTRVPTFVLISRSNGTKDQAEVFKTGSLILR